MGRSDAPSPPFIPSLVRVFCQLRSPLCISLLPPSQSYIFSASSISLRCSQYKNYAVQCVTHTTYACTSLLIAISGRGSRRLRECEGQGENERALCSNCL